MQLPRSQIHPGREPQQLSIDVPQTVARAMGWRPGQNVQWSVDRDGQVRLQVTEAEPSPPAAAAAAAAAAQGKKGAAHC